MPSDVAEVKRRDELAREQFRSLQSMTDEQLKSRIDLESLR
jgi:hypothetical protein